MPKVYVPRSPWYLFAFLILVSTLPFIRLLWGQYLYDDVSHIEVNEALFKLKNFSDVLAFKMQPSRPLSSWTMGLVHWISGGQLWAHRLASLLMHAACTLLVFFTVKNLRTSQLQSPRQGFALFAATAFALHPLQAEIVAVGTFRWEQWAAIFTLICMNLALALSKQDKQSIWIALFVCLGLSFLSKETFSILTPVAVLGVFHYTGSLTRKVFFRVAFMTVPWGLLLGCLLLQPTDYTYEGILSRGLEATRQLYAASANALVEQGWKMLSGQRLVFLRLFERQGILGPLSMAEATAIFLLGLGLWYATWRQKGLIRLWGTLFFSGSYLYLAIPNFNVGSQHYYYYLLFPFICLLGQISWELASKYSLNPTKTVTVIAIAYLFVFFGSLQSRILDMRSRVDFNLAELRNHPESPRAWAIAIDNYRSETNSAFLPDKVWPLALAGYARFPERHYFAALYAEFLYAHGKVEEGFKKAEEILKKVDALDLGAMSISLAVKAAKAGDCLGTKLLLEHCPTSDPAYAEAEVALKGLSKLIATTPEKCTRL